MKRLLTDEHERTALAELEKFNDSDRVNLFAPLVHGFKQVRRCTRSLVRQAELPEIVCHALQRGA